MEDMLEVLQLGLFIQHGVILWDAWFSITSLKTWVNVVFTHIFRLIIENRVSHILQPAEKLPLHGLHMHIVTHPWFSGGGVNGMRCGSQCGKVYG